MLTQDRLKTLLNYAPATGVFTWLVSSKNGTKAGSVAGCLRKGRTGAPDYVVIRIPGDKLYLAHRLAYFYMTGRWPEGQLDHKNLTGTDNRWRNLRPATHFQNNQNRPVRADNKSGLKGVHLDSRRGTWSADCQVEGQRFRKSGFATPEEASTAYQAFAKQHHGEFYHE